MKYYLSIWCYLFIQCCFGQYASQNMTLLGHWSAPGAHWSWADSSKYAGVWGWKDTIKNKEYALVGGSGGTYFVEVTNPAVPALRAFVKGRRDSCLWREIKTYKHYAYLVSDDPTPNSFQIADMQYLPDSVHIVYDDTTLFQRSHTIYIDGDKLYCGSVTRGNTYMGMNIYSLSNPILPAFLRTVNTDYPGYTFSHDMFVRHDTIYASAGNSGLYVFRYNAITNHFILINSLTSYPAQGFNHSSWLTPNGRTLIFTDEVPTSKAVKSLDVSNINNLVVLDTFRATNGATGHNPYVVSNWRAVIAYYMDGVQIFDISNPSHVQRTGFFKTDTLDGPANHFNSNGIQYRGCWGAYPFLPSGIILANDMQNGLFILNGNLALGIHDPAPDALNMGIYPNPARDEFTVSIAASHAQKIRYELYDAGGRDIMGKTEQLSSASATLSVDVSTLPRGLYFLRVIGEDFHSSAKIMIVN